MNLQTKRRCMDHEVYGTYQLAWRKDKTRCVLSSVTIAARTSFSDAAKGMCFQSGGATCSLLSWPLRENPFEQVGTHASGDACGRISYGTCWTSGWLHLSDRHVAVGRKRDALDACCVPAAWRSFKMTRLRVLKHKPFRRLLDLSGCPCCFCKT